jgi:uncharacterized membrane protein
LEPPGDSPSEAIVQVGWAGPLPDPRSLAAAQLVENGAERTVRQWEIEADHRRRQETASLRATFRADMVGRITAFIFCMSALALTAWCAAIGQGWIAAVVGGGTIATVAAALVYKGHVGQRE